MMEIGPFRLIASDLDGTLLRKGEIVSERTHLALERVQEAGATIVLVTGRPPRTMQSIAEAAGVSGLAICSNGAIIYDLKREKIVEYWFIEPEITTRLIAQLREAVPGVHFALEYGLHVGREPGFPAPRTVLPGFELLIDDALTLAREPGVKLIAYHSDLSAEALVELAAPLAGDAALVTHSGIGFIEISAADIHKGWGLAHLCTRLGIAASEVIAFGDMPNDIPMLAWAGHGVAVANAHPTVLEQADEITLSNMEDGVAVVLERLISQKLLLDHSSPNRSP